MIEGFIENGGRILEKEDIIDSRIVKVGIEDDKGNPKKIIFIDFDTEIKKVKFIVKEMDENTVFEHLYLGREGGPNANQIYVTFTNSTSLTSEVISQLTATDVAGDIKTTLDYIIKEFYYDFGEKVTPKYRFMLDLHGIGVISENIDEIYNKCKDNPKPYKLVQDYLQKEIQKYIEESNGAKKKQIGLYTISINGQPIATSKWYRNLIENRLTQQSKSVKSDNKLFCSYCGSTDGCTSDLSEMSIKYYTTNQLIFANNFDRKNYDKNMVLCKKCKDKLLTGEKFIQNQMRGKISKLDVYIIPHIVYSKYEFKQSDLYRLSDKLKRTINTANNIDDLKRYKEDLYELGEAGGEGNHFLINLMFYKRMNQATKVLKLIKDINPDIFEKIGESTNLSQIKLEEYFSQGITSRKFQRGLNLVYYMTPIRLSQQSPAQYQNVLNIYEALFYGRKLHRREIISNITKCLKINWFEQGEYNVSSLNSRDFIDLKIVDGLYYMSFLENMGNVERSENMDVSMLNLKNNYKNYITDMGYGEQQTSLFLLGCLVGAVGRSQKRRDSDNKNGGTYKPVLHKLNFNGMDFTKVKRLSSEIFNKLRQEKILIYTEAIFYAHKTLLGLNENNWKYNKDENLYYILSGYAYETMKKWEEKENE